MISLEAFTLVCFLSAFLAFGIVIEPRR